MASWIRTVVLCFYYNTSPVRMQGIRRFYDFFRRRGNYTILLHLVIPHGAVLWLATLHDSIADAAMG